MATLQVRAEESEWKEAPNLVWTIFRFSCCCCMFLLFTTLRKFCCCSCIFFLHSFHTVAILWLNLRLPLSWCHYSPPHIPPCAHDNQVHRGDCMDSSHQWSTWSKMQIIFIFLTKSSYEVLGWRKYNEESAIAKSVIEVVGKNLLERCCIYSICN